VDIAAPNINLSAVLAVDISEKTVFSHGRVLGAERSAVDRQVPHLVHDPEKCAAVFRKGRAQLKT
jgi:hypothetical protein